MNHNVLSKFDLWILNSNLWDDHFKTVSPSVHLDHLEDWIDVSNFKRERGLLNEDE